MDKGAYGIYGTSPIDEMTTYILKKNYVDSRFGELPVGSEIRFMRGICYFNGGMVPVSYAEILRGIIEDPALKREYIEERPIIYNKV